MFECLNIHCTELTLAKIRPGWQMLKQLSPKHQQEYKLQSGNVITTLLSNKIGLYVKLL